MEPNRKNYIGFKEILFLILGLLVFCIIAIVDISFYHVPSFIKNFHTEREIVIGLAFLALIPFLKGLSSKLQRDLKQTLYITLGLLLSMIMIVTIIQIMGGQSVNLWNNNPLLAENPDSWTIFSSFMTIISSSIVVIILYNIKYFILVRTGQKSDILFKLSLFIILAFSLVLNFYEDHYSYKQLGNIIPINDISIYAWGGIGGVIFLFAALKNNWIETLNSREKIGTLVSITIILVISIYFYLSPLATKLYALSVTLKGFLLSAQIFVIIYLFMADLKLLFHLPLIRYHEQMERELQAVREISEFVSKTKDKDAVLKKIMEHITDLTEANICWIENKIEQEYQIVSHKNIALEKAKLIAKIARSKRSSKKEFYYYDLFRDNIKDYLADLKKDWKFLIVIPVHNSDVDTFLYLISNKRKALNTRNINSLKTFITLLQIIRN